MSRQVAASAERRCAGDARLEHIGIQIGSVGPADDPEFGIDSDFSKLNGITQRCEDAVERDQFIECDRTLDAILKSNSQDDTDRRGLRK